MRKRIAVLGVILLCLSTGVAFAGESTAHPSADPASTSWGSLWHQVTSFVDHLVQHLLPTDDSGTAVVPGENQAESLPSIFPIIDPGG